MALSIRGVSKSFGATQALWPLNLDVPAGEVHALLGENGSGKSTLIKILSGFHRPDEGVVHLGGDVLTFGSAHSSRVLGCRFVHQDLGLVDSETVLDNLSAGSSYPTRFGTIDGRAARRSATRDLERVGVDINPRATVGSLSPALQTAVAVARALRPSSDSEPRLLVLDEPTARLPEREVEQLIAIVRAAAQAGVAVIYVTHRIDEVFELASTASVLRDGHKVATRQVADLNRRDLVELLVGGALDAVAVESYRAPETSAAPVLEIEGLSATGVNGVSLSVSRGEIVGVAGITGSGRESILAAIFGGIHRFEGSVSVNGSPVQPTRPDKAIAAGIAYLPPDRKISGGIMDQTARENLTLADLTPFWRWPRMSRRQERAECVRWFDRLSVRPRAGVEYPLGSFSGGNQQKVLFAKWLRLAPKVLLLDEPTQGVDIATKVDLHKEVLNVAESGACAIISSSDVDELIDVCHRILVMRGGKVVATLTGKEKTVSNISHASFGTAIGVTA